MTETKIETCKSIREASAKALCTVFKKVLVSEAPISEAQLRDYWLEETRKTEGLSENGWYGDPRTKGFGVLFASKEQPKRMNYDSLRSKKNHPQENIYFDPETGIAYLYASFYNPKTFTIGDFGVTLYAGQNPEIIDHLRKCYQVNRQIYEFVSRKEKAENELTFSEIALYSQKLADAAKLTNNVTSITDPAGVNIGHTVPGTIPPWTEEQLAALNFGDESVINKTISRARRFVNTSEQLKVSSGIVFTIEPRYTSVDNPNIPMSSFHTMLGVQEDREIVHLANFDLLFKLMGMDYMTE